MSVIKAHHNSRKSVPASQRGRVAVGSRPLQALDFRRLLHFAAQEVPTAYLHKESGVRAHPRPTFCPPNQMGSFLFMRKEIPIPIISEESTLTKKDRKTPGLIPGQSPQMPWSSRRNLAPCCLTFSRDGYFDLCQMTLLRKPGYSPPERPRKPDPFSPTVRLAPTPTLKHHCHPPSE